MQEGEESYLLYKKEREGLLSSLKKRATMIENVSGWLHCQMTAKHELPCVKHTHSHSLCMVAPTKPLNAQAQEMCINS